MYDFLVKKEPAVAARAMRTIDRGAESLAAFPEGGRPLGDDTGRRKLFVPFGAGAYVLRVVTSSGRDLQATH